MVRHFALEGKNPFLAVSVILDGTQVPGPLSLQAIKAWDE
jgi:hypothetical protein